MIKVLPILRTPSLMRQAAKAIKRTEEAGHHPPALVAEVHVITERETGNTANANVVIAGRVQQADRILPQVHIAIADAKRLPLDICYSICSGYLRICLNGLCRKFNRRCLW